MFNIIIFFLFFALPDRNKTTWYKTLKHTPNMTTIEWMEKGLSQLAKQCGSAKIAGGPGSNPSLTRSTLRVLKLIMRMCWYLQLVTNFTESSPFRIKKSWALFLNSFLVSHELRPQECAPNLVSMPPFKECRIFNQIYLLYQKNWWRLWWWWWR